MLKKYLSYLIACLLLLAPATQRAAAGQPKAQQAATVEDVKIKISKLGVGAKAKATIFHKDGTKTKGYIARAGEDDFVVRDRKTDNATTIRYAEVAKVDSNKGHSTARNIGIGVGIGAGAFLAAILIIFASLED